MQGLSGLQQKIEAHRRFWRGEGPCLILIPTAAMDLYDVEGYPDRFYCPRKMWEVEMQRARPVLEWPTDGIPTVRPNLGTIFIPAIAGQSYRIQEGQMPWPGEPLRREAIRSAVSVDIAAHEMMLQAERFYAIHRDSGWTEIAPYHPDTQGVFDIAHLLYGNEIFTDLFGWGEDPWIKELLAICLEIYVRVSSHLKSLLVEEADTMIHGHGTPQGVYFPNAGVRTSEDTPVLLSPRMIERVILPEIERAVEPFGGAFAHFCGRHEFLFEQLCRSPAIRAIDLGNSELYDRRRLFERCAETETVLYSRLAAGPDEAWEPYLRRIAALVRETGARCILRPTVFPDTREGCAEMLDLWHELTDR